MKKITTLALAALMAVCMSFTLTACGEKRDPNTLTVMIYQQETEQEIYNALASEFQKNIREQTGNQKFKVDLQYKGGESYFTDLKAKATAKKLPDIIYVRPGDVRQYVKNGLIKNITAMINDMGEQKDIYNAQLDTVWENALDFFRFDKENDTNGTGDLYALPKDYSQYVLGYNETWFNSIKNDKIKKYVWDRTAAANNEQYDKTTGEKTGQATDYASWSGEPLDIYDFTGNKVRTDYVKLPGYPGEKIGDNFVVYTFEEFGYLSYLATKRGDSVSTSAAVTTGDQRIMGTGMWEEMCLMAYVWGNGSDFLKDNYKTSNITDEKFVEAYQQFLDLRYVYYSNNGASENDPFEDFGAGNLAICPVGTWDIAYFAERFTHYERSFDLMPWPCASSFDASAASGTLNDVLSNRQNKWKARADSVGYGISRDCSNDTVALAFIQYLSTNENVQKQLANSGAQIPNIKTEADAFVSGENYDFATGYPDNRALLMEVADTTDNGNGKYGPTVFTYNDEWFSAGFLKEIGKTTATSDRMNAKQYCDYINPTVQQKLDEGWQMETDDAEGCGSFASTGKFAPLALAALAAAALGITAAALLGKKKKSRAE